MNHSLLILLSVVLVVGISSTAFAQEETNSPVEVTVSSDKLSYYFDETAVIQGTVSEIIYPVHSNFQPSSSSDKYLWTKFFPILLPCILIRLLIMRPLWI